MSTIIIISQPPPPPPKQQVQSSAIDGSDSEAYRTSAYNAALRALNEAFATGATVRVIDA